MRATAIFFIALLVWPSYAIGLSGNDWMQTLQPDQRSAYIAGALDGWGVGGTEQFSQLYLCVTRRGIAGQQIHAIVDKYILDNPSQMHMSLILIVRNALEAACK
jgi:hypothetical protein